MQLLVFFITATVACAQSRFTFTTAQKAEVIASLEMSSPGADWGQTGREAAVADISLDGRPHQNVMLYAGAKRHAYRVSLGLLSPGEHSLVIQQNRKYSAAGTGVDAHQVKVEEVPEASPDYDVYRYAPVIFARLNTIGRFSDIPLLLYCERLRMNGEDTLQYTVIFSNEDGGTSTRTLMARWGRTTDIEYVYRRSMKSGQAIVQGPGHVDVEFKGTYDADHPLLMPVTDNNMIAAANDSPLRYRLAAIPVDLSRSSREQVMDGHPVTYEVMVKELEREGKLRPFGVAAAEKVSNPKNYLFIDYAATLTNAAVTVLVRLSDSTVYASDLGRSDFAIARDGYVRTTVELPPGTLSVRIKELTFECRVAPPPKGEPPAHSGSCNILSVPKVFQLQGDYTPGKSIWWSNQQVTLPTGRAISFQP